MPSKVQSIALGAAVTAVIGIVQLLLTPALGTGAAAQSLPAVLCCVTAIFGAGAAVWHYASTYNLTIPAGTGAGMGAAALAAGSVVSYLIGLVLRAAGLTPSEEELLERAREAALAQNPELSPEQLDQIMGMSEMFTGVVGFLVGMVVLVVVGAIIGAVAASIFKKGPQAAV